MKNKILLLAAMCASFFCSSGQNKDDFDRPDYKKIKTVTRDKSSSAYYPKLLERYMANDTTLTGKQIYWLYYGKPVNEHVFSEIKEADYRDSITYIYNKDSMSRADRKNLVRYYLSELQADPFSLKTLNSLITQYKYFKDRQTDAYLFKLREIAKVILASGDGLSQETSYYVNSVSDEYIIVAVRGLQYSETRNTIDDKHDYVDVNYNKRYIRGLYFYVER